MRICKRCRSHGVTKSRYALERTACVQCGHIEYTSTGRNAAVPAHQYGAQKGGRPSSKRLGGADGQAQLAFALFE